MSATVGVVAEGGWSRLAPGTVVGERFEVRRLRGEGGMGAVYEAEDRVIGRPVALKLLTATDGAAVERFQREAQAASRISSRHVAAVHDFGRDPQHGLYMVMELLLGRGLDEVLAAGPLTPSQAASVGADVADALHAAHGRGVVHRDLKPANVLALDEGGLKVVDFGIARVLRGEDPGAPGLTGEGTIVGTPTYISPEAVAGETVGPAADLYALGVMLFEMVAGRPPFLDDVPSALCTKHLRQPAPPLGAVRPDLALPEGYAELVEALLDKDPARRPRSADEVAALLRAMSEEGGPVRLAGEAVGAGAPTAHLPPPEASRVLRRPRWTWAIAGSGLAAVALLGLAWAFSVERGEDSPEATLPVHGARAGSSDPSRSGPSTGTGASGAGAPAGTGAPDGAGSSDAAGAPPETVRVDVTVRPPGARLRLDGEPVRAPFDLTRDHAEHELEVRAPGYRPVRRVITADRDRALEIALRRRPRGRRLPALREW